MIEVLFEDDKMKVGIFCREYCISSRFRSVSNECDKHCAHTEIAAIKCAIRMSKLAINEDTGKRFRSLSKLVLLLDKYERKNTKVSK